MRSIRSFLLTLFMAMTLVACAPEDVALNTYKVLNSSAVTYETVMKSAADMHRAGQLSDADWEEVLKAATIFYDAYQTATAALHVFTQLQDNAQDPDPAGLVVLSDQCTTALNNFVSRAYQLGVTIKDTVGDKDG